MKLKALGLALAGLLAVAVPAAAQESPGFEVSFVDAKTGAPIAGACLGMVNEADRNVVETRVMVQCSDSSGTVRNYYTSPHKFYVFTRDGSYGSQWVSAYGGTGDLERAKTFEAVDKVTRVKVKLGAAGAVSGVVTDAAGAPVAGVCPMPTPSATYWNNHVGVSCSDAAGKYTISGLGEFAWKVQFPDYTGKFAWEWSGNAANRHQASAVRVKGGETTTVNAKLSPAGSVTGKIRNAPDQGQFVSVYAVNRWTGDFASPLPVKDSGVYTLNGLNTQQVEIHFQAMATPEYTYPRPVRVTAGQTTPDIDLEFPAQK